LRIYILLEKAVKIYHFLGEELDFTKFLERITTGLKRTRPKTIGSVIMAVFTLALSTGLVVTRVEVVEANCL